MDVKDLAALDAVELLALFEAGEATPLQALQGVTERIARRNPEINAFAAMNPAALDAARESTLRWQAGKARALEGVPVTVSDLVDVAGLPTRQGSKTTNSAPVRRDAPAIAVLRATGAVIIGKTNVSEFGWAYQGDSPLSGIIRNPWNRLYTAGGPSGGAAAAAAGFFAPLHIADGEVCVPAAWSGVVGLKLGTMSETQGLVARSVADVALLSAVLKGQLRAGEPVATVAGLKIGLLRHPGFVAPASATAWQAVDEARTILARQGAVISEIAPALPNLEVVFATMRARRCARAVADVAPEQRALLDPGLRALVTRFDAEPADDQHFSASLSGAERSMADLDVEVLLCPAVPHGAPLAADEAASSSPAPTGAAAAAWTMLFCLTGQPALTLPMGIDADGLPTAIQIAAKPGKAERALNVARALERGLE